jgi:hypothetical protein
MNWFTNNQSLDLATAEELIVRTRRESLDELPWHVRSSTAAASLGVKAALTQAIITWSRTVAAPVLRIVDMSQEELAAVQRIDDLLLIACLMAHDVRDAKGNSVRKWAFARAKDRVETMIKTPIMAEGAELLLLCADMSTKAHLPVFYKNVAGIPKVKEESAFINTAAKILNSFLPPRSLVPYNPTVNLGVELGKILYELFNNTERWATEDERGVQIRRSVRGVYAAVQNWESSIQDEPIREYSRDAAQGTSSALELSIFDSGPGLAQRFLGRRILESEELPSELRAVMACLTKHRTSSGESHRGLGLHRVMQVLDSCQGFLRIRTGRLCLYRDFISRRYADHSSIPNLPPRDPILLDWESGSLPETPYAPAEGAMLTIFLPLRSVTR